MADKYAQMAEESDSNGEKDQVVINTMSSEHVTPNIFENYAKEPKMSKNFDDQELQRKDSNGSNESVKCEGNSLSEVIDTPITKPHIGKIEECPKWLIDNHYILTGYRINFSTVKLTFKSLFMCHNESTNIWSHLCGVITFVCFIMYIAFFVGGLSLTKPLDFVIDQFEANSINACRVPEGVCDDCMNLWIRDVEQANPDYFASQTTYFSTLNRDAMLLETADSYLHMLIQRYMFVQSDKICKRDIIYENYLGLQPDIQNRVKLVLDNVEKEGDSVKIIALNNLQRNIKYHFESDEVKKLILSEDTNKSDQLMHDLTRIPLYIHMISAIICLSFSSLFHLFCNCNEKANNYFSRLDYSGISILIAGSCMPPYFYSFYCSETIEFAYAYSIGIFSICLVAFIVTMIPKFDAPKFRWLRAVLYIIAGLSTAIPAFHMTLVPSLYLYPSSFWAWSTGGAIYIAGATIYAVRTPERFFPKRFDYFGSSHNIFHFCVIIAAAIHFYGALNNYHGRRVLMC